MGGNNVTVTSASHRIPADGKSWLDIELAFSEQPESNCYELKLGGLGSFDAAVSIRRMRVPVRDKLAQVRVYGPWRPGSGVLRGEGLRYRLDFPAKNFIQGLVLDWVPTLAIALVIAMVLKTYALANFFVPSGSMMDTLKVGDLFIADKLSFQLLGKEPQRGDIMVFKHPTDTGDPWVKRVIGLPGDTVLVSDGKVYINDQELAEDYIREEPHRDFGPTTVPEGEYFVMGDNRNNSRDSREWGFLPEDNLLGRASVVIWPPNHVRVLPHEEY